MGDPLSAAALVLSLPGIFMSCVQCFELIQDGKNFERDLLVLTTKFSNQQLRFTKWGEACGFGSPSGHDRRLDRAEFEQNIKRTLLSIKLLLDSGVAISRKYEDEPPKNQVLGTSTHWSWTAVRKRLRRTQKSGDVKDATKWALSDKKKLDEIVRHLNDLVNDLEKITEGLGVSEQQRYLVQYEIQSISDTQTLELIESSRIGPTDTVSDAASARLRDIQSGSLLSCPQPGSLAEVLSVPDTTNTTETYATAFEDFAVDQGPHSIETAQNSRIMNSLLSTTASPTQIGSYHWLPTRVGRYGDNTVSTQSSLSHQSARRTDAPALETLIDIVCFEAFDEASRNNSHHFRHVLVEGHKKITSELEKFNQEKQSDKGLSWWHNLQVIGDDLGYVLGTFQGPVDSPYEGGIFHMIFCMRTYPWKAPRCLMVTKVYHPNIDSRGELCIDILKADWAPSFTMEKLLVSTCSILDDPGLEDPLVPEIAETYIRNRSVYEENARAYTQKYAREARPSPETLQRFIGMCERLGQEQSKP